MRIADRASTEDEQRRFTAAARDEFTNSLAMVNTALSTWPVLRRDDSAGAKADHVAVAVYLGHSEARATALNAALRSGSAPAWDSYLPCLISGLRRLPVHRRGVLCHGEAPDRDDPRWRVGAVLTDRAFRTASADLEIVVPGADADILIWSRTGRQVSILDPTLDEVVFAPGARFRTLAVDTATDEPAEGAVAAPDPRPPKVAILLRELLPAEQPAGAALDDADQLALRRLSGALARRRSGQLRQVDDPDAAARTTAAGLELA